MTENPNKNFDEKIIELEARQEQVEVKLIEQEHRLIPSILNFLRLRKASGEKRIASIKSLATILIFGQKVTMAVAIGSSLVALVSLYISYNGNRLMKEQNDRIDIQNESLRKQVNLDEANRRGSLVFLMANILDEVDEELDNVDNKERNLSSQLIGRIAALSQSLKPYLYLEHDTLISKAVSPERGFFLLSLLRSNLSKQTYDSIFSYTTFAHAELLEANLNNINSRGIDLEGAVISKAFSINAILDSANLREANLEGAYFENVVLKNATLIDANLRNVRIRGGDLSNATLSSADLSGVGLIVNLFENKTVVQESRTYSKITNFSNSDLFRTSFRNASLLGANLSNVNIFLTDFRGADLRGVVLSHKKNHLSAITPIDFNNGDFLWDSVKIDLDTYHNLFEQEIKDSLELHYIIDSLNYDNFGIFGNFFRLKAKKETNTYKKRH